MAEDYMVGKGRPPRHSRFKPGRSGNPKGKPKGQRNLRSELLDELLGNVTVKESGKLITVSKVRAMIKSLMAKAAGGDVRAATYLVDTAMKLEGLEGQGGHADAPEDEAILAAYRQRLAREGGHE